MSRPPITTPVVMYEAITVYHEWGPHFWETDYWGNPTRGSPPTNLQKAIWIAPMATGLIILIGLLVLTVAADVRRLIA